MPQKYAFPTTQKTNNNYLLQGGLTLRDYFAGQALIALSSQISNLSNDELVNRAFAIANLMKKKRQVGHS